MAVESEPCAGDGVECCGGGIFDGLPSAVAGIERGFSYAAVGMIQQRAALRHRQSLLGSIGEDHVEFELGGNRTVKPTPSLHAVHPKISRQYFFVGGHGALGFFTHPMQIIFRAAELRPRRQSREGLLVGGFDGAQKLDSDFSSLGAHPGKIRFFFKIVFIVCIGGREATYVGT